MLRVPSGSDPLLKQTATFFLTTTLVGGTGYFACKLILPYLTAVQKEAVWNQLYKLQKAPSWIYSCIQDPLASGKSALITLKNSATYSESWIDTYAPSFKAPLSGALVSSVAALLLHFHPKRSERAMLFKASLIFAVTSVALPYLTSTSIQSATLWGALYGAPYFFSKNTSTFIGTGALLGPALKIAATWTQFVKTSPTILGASLLSSGVSFSATLLSKQIVKIALKKDHEKIRAAGIGAINFVAVALYLNTLIQFLGGPPLSHLHKLGIGLLASAVSIFPVLNKDAASKELLKLQALIKNKELEKIDLNQLSSFLAGVKNCRDLTPTTVASYLEFLDDEQIIQLLNAFHDHKALDGAPWLHQGSYGIPVILSPYKLLANFRDPDHRDRVFDRLEFTKDLLKILNPEEKSYDEETLKPIKDGLIKKIPDCDTQVFGMFLDQIDDPKWQEALTQRIFPNTRTLKKTMRGYVPPLNNEDLGFATVEGVTILLTMSAALSIFMGAAEIWNNTAPLKELALAASLGTIGFCTGHISKNLLEQYQRNKKRNQMEGVRSLTDFLEVIKTHASVTPSTVTSYLEVLENEQTAKFLNALNEHKHDDGTLWKHDDWGILSPYQLLAHFKDTNQSYEIFNKLDFMKETLDILKFDTNTSKEIDFAALKKKFLEAVHEEKEDLHILGLFLKELVSMPWKDRLIKEFNLDTSAPPIQKISNTSPPTPELLLSGYIGALILGGIASPIAAKYLLSSARVNYLHGVTFTLVGTATHALLSKFDILNF